METACFFETSVNLYQTAQRHMLAVSTVSTSNRTCNGTSWIYRLSVIGHCIWDKYKSILVLVIDLQLNLMEGQVLALRAHCRCRRPTWGGGRGQKVRSEKDDMGTPCKYFSSFFFPEATTPTHTPSPPSFLFTVPPAPLSVTLTPFKKDRFCEGKTKATSLPWQLVPVPPRLPSRFLAFHFLCSATTNPENVCLLAMYSDDVNEAPNCLF